MRPLASSAAPGRVRCAGVRRGRACPQPRPRRLARRRPRNAISRCSATGPRSGERIALVTDRLDLRRRGAWIARGRFAPVRSARRRARPGADADRARASAGLHRIGAGRSGGSGARRLHHLIEIEGVGPMAGETVSRLAPLCADTPPPPRTPARIGRAASPRPPAMSSTCTNRSPGRDRTCRR